MKNHTIITLIAAFLLCCAMYSIYSQQMGLALICGSLEFGTIMIGIRLDSKNQQPI